MNLPLTQILYLWPSPHTKSAKDGTSRRLWITPMTAPTIDRWTMFSSQWYGRVMDKCLLFWLQDRQQRVNPSIVVTSIPKIVL